MGFAETLFYTPLGGDRILWRVCAMQPGTIFGH